MTTTDHAPDSPFTASWCREVCREIIRLAPLVKDHAGAMTALRTILATVESADWSGAEDEVFDARAATTTRTA